MIRHHCIFWTKKWSSSWKWALNQVHCDFELDDMCKVERIATCHLIFFCMLSWNCRIKDGKTSFRPSYFLYWMLWLIFGRRVIIFRWDRWLCHFTTSMLHWFATASLFKSNAICDTCSFGRRKFYLSWVSSKWRCCMFMLFSNFWCRYPCQPDRLSWPCWFLLRGVNSSQIKRWCFGCDWCGGRCLYTNTCGVEASLGGTGRLLLVAGFAFALALLLVLLLCLVVLLLYSFFSILLDFYYCFSFSSCFYIYFWPLLLLLLLFLLLYCICYCLVAIMLKKGLLCIAPQAVNDPRVVSVCFKVLEPPAQIQLSSESKHIYAAIDFCSHPIRYLTRC